jgi:hypothetical protein
MASARETIEPTLKTVAHSGIGSSNTRGSQALYFSAEEGEKRGSKILGISRKTKGSLGILGSRDKETNFVEFVG